MTPACLTAALDYLRRGWSPVPVCPPNHYGTSVLHRSSCTQPGKTPLEPWHQYTTKPATSDELKQAWKTNPQLNVALVLSPAYPLLAVDIDGIEGEKKLLELLGTDLTTTIEYTTARGRRLLYLPPTDQLIHNLAISCPGDHQGIEILVKSKMCVMPPSIHAHGTPYAWKPGRSPKDISVARTPSSIYQLYLHIAKATPTKNSSRQSVSVQMHNVRRRPVRYLWDPYLPLGKVTVIDGDPDLGKSTLLLDIAAKVTLGATFPNGAHCEPANVIILTAEDSLDDTVRPRLEAADADLKRIRAISAVTENGTERPVTIPGDLPLIQHHIENDNAKFLLIDPLMAYLTGDSCKDQDVRKALHSLSRMAELTQCNTTMLRHLNKGSATKAIYRGGGSIGIIGAARSGLMVARDPGDDRVRVLASTKANLSAPPKSLRFELEYVEDLAACRIRWLGESELTANDLVSNQEQAREEAGAVAVAEETLTQLLSAGPKSAEDCKKQAAKNGVSLISLRRAKHRLRVTSRQEPWGSTSRWVWCLPNT